MDKEISGWKFFFKVLLSLVNLPVVLVGFVYWKPVTAVSVIWPLVEKVALDGPDYPTRDHVHSMGKLFTAKNIWHEQSGTAIHTQLVST